MDQFTPTDYRQLLGERSVNPFHQFSGEGVRNRRVLLTGAGGSIGSALARMFSAASPERLVMLDHSEQALFNLQESFSGGEYSAPHEFALGDIRDEALMTCLLEQNAPQIIVHAAAFKHVPLLEANPFAAVQNNGLATWQLARTAARRGIRLVLISTDKAANPCSILGVSKRIAELATLRWGGPGTGMSAIRLGNVAGSSGSVLPAFQSQIESGGPVKVTHAEASRYFLTMDETCAAIGALVADSDAAGVYLPTMGEALSILELAQRLIARHAPSGLGIAIEFCGLRPGDKVREDLISKSETLGETIGGGLRRILCKAVPADYLNERIATLETSVRDRDLRGLLSTLRDVIPEFEPGSSLSEQCKAIAGGCDE